MKNVFIATAFVLRNIVPPDHTLVGRFDVCVRLLFSARKMFPIWFIELSEPDQNALNTLKDGNLD